MFIVLPIILSLTLFSDHIAVILLLQSVALISLIIFSLCEYCFIAREKPTLRQIFYQIVQNISHFRSVALVATAIAILGVDFDVFPRRFAKTYTYGRSVMDLGTATFVFCFAVVDVFRDFPGRARLPQPPTQTRFFLQKHSSSTILLCLGVGRALLLYLFDYPQQVVEYGVHWNFFITLAFLRAIVKLLGRRFHVFYGIIIISVYQYLLVEKNLQVVTIELFLLIFVLIRLKSWFYRCFQLLMIAAMLFVAQKTAEIYVGPPSRRIANLPYVLEMLVFHTILMAGVLFVQLVSVFGWAAHMPQFSVDESPFERLKPCILDSVNRYGMLFFLLTNVLTGLVNLSITTTNVTNALHSTAIIIAYMLASCATIHYYVRLRDYS
ncbi:unnamed protein product [Gongylonema pulchrum]|uniref:Phosphatidylinositol-glycan biosynthesis class W protein n=1 Tax=Gongylonema pulchrum TaxID=637853 RepID=A0A183E4F3_9BILA|nr:unnamed protein product [Gongylonema pulchrum]